jgi:rRNA methylases
MNITSLTNTKVKDWVKLQKKKHRDENKLFLIEGEHLVKEAEKQGIIQQLILQEGIIAEITCSEIYYVTEEIMKKISTNLSTPKMVAVCNYFESEARNAKKIIALDEIQDPGNLGTIIRTAVSFGFDALLLSNHSVDCYNDKLLRATQGAIFQIPVLSRDILSSVQEYKKRGYQIYATALENASSLETVACKEPYILIFGNEGRGVSNELLEIADERIRIDMEGFESLNVGVATGIILYHFSKQ